MGKNIMPSQRSPIPLHKGTKYGVLNSSYKEREQLYLTKQWKDLRYHFLRENPYCVICAKNGKEVKASIVDHVNGHDPLTWREDFFNGEFQALCWPCHSRKTCLEDMKNKPKRMTASEREKIIRDIAEN